MSAEHAEHQATQTRPAVSPAVQGVPIAPQPAPEIWQLLQQSIGNRALGRMIEGRDDRMRSDSSRESYTQPGAAQTAGYAAASRRGLNLQTLMGLQGSMGNAFVGRLLHHVSEADAPSVARTSGHVDPAPASHPGEVLSRLDDGEDSAQEPAPADPANAAPGGDAGDDDDDPNIPKSGSVDPIAGEQEERPETADDEVEAPLQVRASIKLSHTDAGFNRPNAAMGATRSDSVTSNVTIKSSIVEGGVEVPATSFGHERPDYSVGANKWTRDKKVINIECEIVLEAHYGIDPHGRIYVGSANDAVVTEQTWSQIGNDLMPDEGGQPPRTQYFALDLTQLHEQFHGWDDIGQAQKFIPTAKEFLNQQTIDPKGDINAQVAKILEQVRGEFAKDGNNHYLAGGEARAYGDGKQAYENRANEVRMRGIKEKWRPSKVKSD